MLRAVFLTSACAFSLVWGIPAHAAVSKDPRLCGHPAAACGKAAAILDLRRYMTTREQITGLWTAHVTCVGSASSLRWRCAFTNAAEHGWATVTLGAAPAWKPTVKLGLLVCDSAAAQCKPAP